MIPTLPPLTNRTLQRFIHAFAPEKVILFGSYAKGTCDGFSDVDFLFVTRLNFNNHYNRKRVRDLAADCFPKVDVVFATPEEVASAASLKSPFLMSILEKGIVIYTRK